MGLSEAFGFEGEGVVKKHKNHKILGSKFENDVSNLLSKWTGFDFNRTPASGSLRWKARVDVIGDLTCLHEDWIFVVECKIRTDDVSPGIASVAMHHNKKTGLNKFMLQAEADAVRASRKPLLFYKKKGERKDRIIVGMRAEDYLAIFPDDYTHLLLAHIEGKHFVYIYWYKFSAKKYADILLALRS
jgi:Holliday junction resolvase